MPAIRNRTRTRNTRNSDNLFPYRMEEVSNYEHQPEVEIKWTHFTIFLCKIRPPQGPHNHLRFLLPVVLLVSRNNFNTNTNNTGNRVYRLDILVHQSVIWVADQVLCQVRLADWEGPADRDLPLDMDLGCRR